MAWAPFAAAAIPLIASLFENKGGKNDAKQGSTYSKGQRSYIEGILNDLQGMKGGAQNIQNNPQYQQGGEWLNSLFNDQDFFNRFEAPLQRQFQEQTVPDLANRFASQGSGGSLGSTGFRNQLAREGSNLSTNIAALRGGMQQQGVNQSLQYAQQPFNNFAQLSQLGLTPTKNTYQPASAGFWGPIAAQGIGALSQGLGQQFGQSMAGMGGGGGNPGQSPSTYQYPLTQQYDMGFRSGAYGY
jgi:hypothetical protein